MQYHVLRVTRIPTWSTLTPPTQWLSTHRKLRIVHTGSICCVHDKKTLRRRSALAIVMRMRTNLARVAPTARVATMRLYVIVVDGWYFYSQPVGGRPAATSRWSSKSQLFLRRSQCAQLRKTCRVGWDACTAIVQDLPNCGVGSVQS